MEIRPVHADFGAEILGFDFRVSPASGAAERLRDALDRFQLLVLRSAAPLPPEAQVGIAGLFGPPVDNGSGQFWSLLRNEEAAGSIMLPFHQDFTYTDSPIKVITLNAIDLPPGGTSTSFVSNVANWASLPSDLQARLAPMTVRHRHETTIASDWPEFIAHHPVRMAHPRTGAPMLFVTEHHADRILEMDEAESAATLARLFAHSYAEARVYHHRWQPNDLLIWDNLAAQHARREVADMAGGKRVMRRVVINDVTFPELMDRARQAQAGRQAAAACPQG